jgi:hypothetical protein
MSKESKEYLFRIAWGARREASSQCADRILYLLRWLQNYDSVFERWWWGADRGMERKENLLFEHNAVKEMVEEGRDKKAPTALSEQLGYRVSMWSEHQGVPTSKLSISCGGFCSGPYGPFNTVVFRLLLREEDKMHQLISQDEILSMFRCLIQTWDPNWGTVWTPRLGNMLPDPPVGLPDAGWMIYLRVKTDLFQNLSDEVSCVETDSGVVLIVGKQPPSYDDSEAIDHLKSVQSRLKELGISQRVNLVEGHSEK